jgi:hypothetical protein
LINSEKWQNKASPTPQVQNPKLSLLPAHTVPQPVPFPSRPAGVYLMLEKKKWEEKKNQKHYKTKTGRSNYKG